MNWSPEKILAQFITITKLNKKQQWIEIWMNALTWAVTNCCIRNAALGGKLKQPVNLQAHVFESGSSLVDFLNDITHADRVAAPHALCCSATFLRRPLRLRRRKLQTCHHLRDFVSTLTLDWRGCLGGYKVREWEYEEQREVSASHLITRPRIFSSRSLATWFGLVLKGRNNGTEMKYVRG